MAARGPEHVYVYYRLAGDPRGGRARAVAALLADVEARTGVGGRLLVRRDDPRTWMEVYEPVARAGGLRARARGRGAPARRRRRTRSTPGG